MDDAIDFDAELWRHDAGAGWHFLALPAEVADEIRARAADSHRPFGSLPVTAMIGTTSWTTSLFFDTRRGSYLLPVKADVRRRERLSAGAGQRGDRPLDLVPGVRGRLSA